MFPSGWETPRVVVRGPLWYVSPLCYVVHCGTWSIVVRAPFRYVLHFGTWSIVVRGPLWYVLHCGTRSIVVRGPLWYVFHCGTRPIVVRAPFRYVVHCGTWSIVVRAPLWYAVHCGTWSIVVRVPLWYAAHCGTWSKCGSGCVAVHGPHSAVATGSATHSNAYDVFESNYTAIACSYCCPQAGAISKQRSFYSIAERPRFSLSRFEFPS